MKKKKIILQHFTVYIIRLNYEEKKRTNIKNV